MTKSLSGANVTNIAATLQDADILVEMSGISKQWSTKTRGGYETRIVGVSALRQAINPLGGIATRSDFSVTIQQETPTQFIQDQDADNEDVDVSLQYGADAKIPLIKGKLDRWELSRGLLILHCIANTQLINKKLPIQQINSTEFSTFLIPQENDGAWIPVTIGSHATARGLLIDKTADAQKVKFNAAVSGHEGVGALRQGKAWLSGIREIVDVLTSLSVVTAGHLLFASGTNAADGFVELTLRTVPIRVSKDAADITGPGSVTNEGNAIDEDLATFARAQNLCADGGRRSILLHMILRDLPLPENVIVLDDALYLLADIDRTEGGNITVAVQERCEVAIEIDAANIPAASGGGDASPNWRNITPVATIADLIPDGSTSFDNLNTLAQAEEATSLDTSEYASRIGVDLDNDGTAEALPVVRLGGRTITLHYRQARDDGSGNPDPHTLDIQEFRLRIDMRAEALTQNYAGDLDGYDDDGGGTYTGTGSELIENPADVVWFVLAELLGISGINTTAFAAARSDLGSYVIAGQVIDLVDAAGPLEQIAKQGKLKLFTDFNDDWSVKAFDIPAGEDASLVQESGDFQTQDGVAEGEILSITQSSLDELYNQFEILYDWNQATGLFDSTLVLDETTSGPIGDWLTESQSRYNLTRKLTIGARWIRGANSARSYGIHLIHQLADRKRIVEWQTSWNEAEREIGDLARLTHIGVMKAEDTTVYSGYTTSTVPGVAPFTTIKSGFVDPDTSATIKAGAKVQLFQGRHRYEIFDIETLPMDGLIKFTGRQADISRSPLSEPF